MQIIIAAGGSAAAATQAKYESLTAVSLLGRIRADDLLAVVDGASLERLFGFSSGSKSALRIVVSRAGTGLTIAGRDDAEGGYCFCTVPRASLTSGQFVTISVFRTSSAATTAQVIVRQSGTSIDDQTSAVAYGALPTGSGNGAINIGNATYALGVDAFAVFNRAVTTSDHDTAFTSGTSGIVGGYLMGEGSGSTAADVVGGGTALTLTSVTWDSGGTWDGGGAPAPTISGIAPTSGAIGTQVTITGTNLTGATLATHGPTVAMTGLIVDSSTQVRATIAGGSPSTGTIRVTTPGGTAASSSNFTITPIFTSLAVSNPNPVYTIGVLLSPITVRALDQFGATFLGTLTDCTVSSLSLPITVVGTLTVAFVSGIATFSNLTPSAGVLPPSITSFTPTSGDVGTVVTFTGTSFTGVSSVRIGALECAFTVVNDTTITATVPVGAA